MNDNKNEMLQAAYALNLCTVSVSQIIDYDDVQILEQEYEAILNNLNLQNMPDDDALLKILKQLLDTITFFRISEGDKKLVERRYRQKMKNAIWNAVPNFGMIIASGNPVAMAVSLASQVGIGYMNYRKTKAENKLELDEEMWHLQRSAIEQFNGLRRELFDTAWRLSKNYKFDDSLRLTERQISQYNAIIMDGDVVRRYQRLEAIQDNFKAYAPFWYYFGNAANEISRNLEICVSDEIANYYSQKAYEHFNHYWESNSFSLLREDHLASACALELVDIMIERKEEPKAICEFIDNAVKYSGNSCDILQLCGIAYLNIGDSQKAYKTIKYLVNESYNTSVNAQLLSGLLISGYKKTGDAMYKAEYDILEKRNNAKSYLLPWPGTQGVDFMDSQRSLTIEKFKVVFNEYLEKYSQILNRILPVPDAGKEYPNSFFSPDYSDERSDEMKSIFAVREKREDYLYRLCNVGFSIRFIDIYNELLSNLRCWSFVTLDPVYELAKGIIRENQSVINHLQEQIQQQQLDLNDYKLIQRLMAPGFMEKAFTELFEQINRYIENITDMKKISELESLIFNFCEDQGLSQPVLMMQDITEEETTTGTILSYELLGSEVSSGIADMTRYNKMIAKANDINLSLNDKSKISFIKTSNEAFEEYFSDNKNEQISLYKDKTVAILDDRNHGNAVDLLFTATGLLYVVKDKIELFTTYEKVFFDDEKKCLVIHDAYREDIKRLYDGRKIGENNLEQLYEFIKNLNIICSSQEEF